jgi:putative SOS response-associated peptidase YedK
MCSRYYISPVIGEVLSALTHQPAVFQSWNVRPSDTAPILTASDGALRLSALEWGFPASNKKRIINARAETAGEKKMFKRGLARHRVVIPAAGFYEWNALKEKHRFSRKDSPVIYLAGLADRFQNQSCFVILTTAANPSVAPVHSRMPLVLEPDQLVPWISDGRATDALLKQRPAALDGQTGAHQLSMFD